MSRTMRARTAFLALTILAVGVAGCVGGDDVDDAEPANVQDPTTPDAEEDLSNETEEVEDTGPKLETKVFQGTVEGSSTPVGYYYCQPTGTCEQTVEFQVGENVTGVLIEAGWNESVDAAMDMDIPYDNCDTSQGDCPPDSEQGPSPLRMEATGSEYEDKLNGTWNGFIYPDSSTPETIEYTIYVTLVYEGELPAGFSKVDDW